MPRPVTLFTGQWADLTFQAVCHKARQFGYDGIELASWGDHFEVDKALKDKGYVKNRWEILGGMNCLLMLFLPIWLARRCATSSTNGTRRFSRRRFGATVIRTACENGRPIA